jgi:hypothetical protein
VRVLQHRNRDGCQFLYDLQVVLNRPLLIFLRCPLRFKETLGRLATLK